MNNLEILIPYNIQKIGVNKKYFIRTYGCQSNVRDSEVIAGILEAMQYSKVDSPFDADFIVLNTCAIRENAEKKVFGELGYLKQIKYSNPNTIFAVCGCMPQEPHVIAKINKQFHQVDIVFGTHNIHELPNLIEKCFFEQQKAFSIWENSTNIIENLPSIRNSKLKAFVNVMYGCNNYCTYCIVPTTRGKQKSRQLESILLEIKELLEQGYKDITLLGQNVNSWGIDLYNKNSFSLLLEAAAKLDIPRLRFTTSNPWDFSDDIIDICFKYKNIMPYFHLPLQSGDNEILYLMNRNHTIEEYKILFDKIKNKIPNAAFSTDIIVGFPNETFDQFLKTIEIYKYCQFDNAYTFIYSKREGTHAALMPDNVSISEKNKRLVILNTQVRKYSKLQNQKYIGKIVEVLVEGESKKNPEIMSGTTIQNKIVNFKGDKNLIGKFLKVRIDEAKLFTLNGTLIEYV